MRTKQTARKSTSGTAPRRLLSQKTVRAIHDDDDVNDDDNEDARDIYDARLLRVTAALAEVERPGDCFAHRALAQFPLPGLFVDGLGEAALPLRERDARELIARCHLAPYGHGEQTLVDTAVRNTWELSAAQFELRKAQWQRAVDAMAESVRAPLGISEGTEFDVKLYKLLLEKEVGMFGTLVVVLQGHFTGGELVVHHPAMAAAQRAPHVWDPASMSPYDVKYAAFYGDCEHEVKPVTSGFRLCLTYNLVTRSTTRVPRFAGNHALYQRLETALQQFFTETGAEKEQKQERKRQRTSLLGAPARRSVGGGDETAGTLEQRDCQLVYVLEHKYTNPGLSFAYLKNKDHLVAQSLAKFCDDSRGAFSLYLCKVKYTYEYDPDNHEPEYVEKSVQLKTPWIKYGEQTAVPCQQMTARSSRLIATTKPVMNEIVVRVI